MPWTVWLLPLAVWLISGSAYVICKLVKEDFDRGFVWIMAVIINVLIAVLHIVLVVDWYHSAGACERFSKSANVETKLETYGFFKGRHCFVDMGDGTWIGVDSYKGINEQE